MKYEVIEKASRIIGFQIGFEPAIKMETKLVSELNFKPERTFYFRNTEMAKVEVEAVRLILPVETGEDYVISTEWLEKMSVETFLDHLFPPITKKIPLTEIQQLKVVNFKLMERNRRLALRMSEFENAVLTVFGDELKGVQGQTKLRDLMAKAERIRQRDAKAKAKAKKLAEEKKAAEIKKQAAELKEAAAKAILWCDNAPGEDGRYWLAAYTGAIVYRLIIQNGKIMGSIPGGFHESMPMNVLFPAWMEALNNNIREKIGDDYHLVKADGSGTYFYVRNIQDLQFFDATSLKVYDVPSADGGVHTNIEIR